jgi:hypothetical protein
MRAVGVFAALLAFGAARVAPSSAGTNAIAQIALARHGCYGNCPDDRIAIEADGTIDYVGYNFTPKLGRYRGRVDPALHARILAFVAKANFFTIPSMFGRHPDEAATYDITVVRSGMPWRIDVNDPSLAPLAIRQLAGLMSRARDTSRLTSESPLNAVVGVFAGLPSPDRQLSAIVGIDDSGAYFLRIEQRVAPPCEGEPKVLAPLMSGLSTSGGSISGSGFTLAPTAKGLRVVGPGTDVELTRTTTASPPDLPLRSPRDASCPTTIEILGGSSEPSDPLPTLFIASDVELDLASLQAHAHFVCDSAPGHAIAINAFGRSAGQRFEIDVQPAENLAPNTPCRLLIDAGVTPKGPGRAAQAVRSDDLHYDPKR